jgi:membrane associated rhomboid family serine protease
MQRKPNPLVPHSPMPRALVYLAGFIALVEIILSISDMGLFFPAYLRLRVFAAGAFWSPLLHGTSPYFPLQPVTMFITHSLLHGNFVHMAMNTAVLLGLGKMIADHYGPGPILPVFFIGAVAGGGMFGLLTNEAVPMVGASGAVFAFIGVWIVWDWHRHRAAGVSERPVIIRVLVLAGINVAFFFGMDGMLAWEAHLGGFLAGLLCGVVLERRRDATGLAARADERLRR